MYVVDSIETAVKRHGSGVLNFGEKRAELRLFGRHIIVYLKQVTSMAKMRCRWKRSRTTLALFKLTISYLFC